MRLTEFLSLDRIKIPLEGTTMEEILRELINLIGLPDEETKQKVFEVAMEREALMTTGIGNGIAIPHAILETDMELVGALGIACNPVDFMAIDKLPVTLVFFLVSDELHPGRNMKALARIARLLHRQEFRASLGKCSTPEETWRVIEEEEARHKI